MLIRIAMFGGLHYYGVSCLENYIKSSRKSLVDGRTGSGRCCSMWESRLVSESITHHPNMTSPLGDSLCLAPTIYWKGTPRTYEINGAQPRTTEPMSLADWCKVQQETSSYGSLSCIGLYDLSGLATSRLIPSH